MAMQCTHLKIRMTVTGEGEMGEAAEAAAPAEAATPEEGAPPAEGPAPMED